MKTIRKTFRLKTQYDPTSIIKPRLFNMWTMCPRIIVNYSTDGYHIQVNRIPLAIYEKKSNIL